MKEEESKKRLRIKELENEDYFIGELLNKIIYSPQKISLNTVHKCAILLTQYATKCSK